MDITIRPAVDADAHECGRICYEGFRSINERHGFLSNFPSVEIATRRVAAFISHPAVFAIVAESSDGGGRIIGFNFLSERDPIRAIGPIVIDPAVHQRGIGRLLMEAALDRARGARGVRLLQETYNVQSLSLYAALGFEARELFIVLAGAPTMMAPAADYQIRFLTEADLPECQSLHERVHGYSRINELRDAVATGTAIVAIREKCVRAYMTSPTNWLSNHGVGETDHDMQALLCGAARTTKDPLSFLLPVRRAALFRWCLAQGLRTIKPMTLMTLGEYHDPHGTYFPSVLY